MIIKKYDLGLRDLISFRPYTMDEDLVRAILIERTEYSLFIGCNPKVIFDVGANIGITTLLFANTYPDAIIYAFEPEPENFKLLCDNVKSYPNVKPYQLALGASTGEVTLMASDDEYNHGGFSVHDKGVDPTKIQMVQMSDVPGFMASRGIETVDLAKVDTEGCEFDILSGFQSLPTYIMGEAHGVDDWKLFEMLSKTHDLSINKPFGSRVYPFYAQRKPIDAAL